MPNQKPNLQTLYLSERIREVLRHIRFYALTSVVAPMGYGKTTALNWYLEGQARDHGAVVLRLSIYSDNLREFWRQLQNAFAGTDLRDDLQAMEFPESGTGLALFMELLEEYLSTHPREHYLFLDDFHLLSNQRVADFLTDVARRLPSNLHLIVSSRNSFLSRRAVVELSGRLYPIGQDDLRLNFTEIAAYCRSCGVSLTEAEIEQLRHITEGWFSGLYLSLRAYLETGALPTRAGSIYDMMDDVLLAPLTEEDRRFLLSLCLADDFTPEMAAFLSGRADAEALLSVSASRNAFLTLLPDQITYRFHHILKECTQRRFHALPASEQNELHRRYGRWYEDHAHYARALSSYRACEDWPGLLRVLGKDQAMELSFFSQNTVAGWVKDCPTAVLKQDPLALLVLIRRYFSWRMLPEMADLRRLFLEAVAEAEDLTETERNDLLGECELVMSFTAYNSIEKMSEYHQAACRMMSRPALTMGNRGTWTFGSPSVLALFHREPGRLDAELAAMHRSMPYYYRLTQDHGMGAEHIMEAEALFLRGDLGRAKVALEEGRYKAEGVAGKQKEMRFILLCCLFLDLRMSLLGTEGPGEDWYGREAATLRQFRSPLLLTTLDLCAAWYYALLELPDRIPPWLREEDLDRANLLFPARPVAELIVNQVRLAKGDWAQVLARESEVMGLCQVYPYPLCALYLELQLAEACRRMDQWEAAGDHVRRAAAIAGPDGMLLPFAAFPDLADLLPHTLAEQTEGWRTAFRSCRDAARNRFTIPAALAALSGQEQQVALRMAQGKRNREIAAELFLSEGTVKQYVSRIYGKLGLTGTASEKREKLVRLLKN